MNSQHTDIVAQDFDYIWMDYFRLDDALRDVAAYIAALPSSRRDSQRTRHIYQRAIEYFLEWSNGALPDSSLITRFIAHLRIERKLKSSTIGSSYLSPVRLLIKKLVGQTIRVAGAERDFVQDCKESMRNALEIQTPKEETSSDIAPLWRYGTRLTRNQVNSVLRSIDRSTLKGQRDYALLKVAFQTGMRLGELSQITPNSIKPRPGGYLIYTIGKRSKIDPVPVTAKTAQVIFDWVNTYNEGLGEGDPRRIVGDVPVFQALRTANVRGTVGVNGFDPKRGTSRYAIHKIVRDITTEALGEQWSLSPHDMRRTTAAILHMEGKPINAIQKLMRHSDASVTLHYIGEPPSYDDYVNPIEFG